MQKMTFVTPSWRLALFTLGFLSVFLYLGFWQLERASAKEAMLELAKELANQPGELLHRDLEVGPGEPLRVKGQFDPNVVFLSDNRVLKGRVGYEVVQLFVTDDHLGVLVNRGFLAGHRTRDQLPEVPATSPVSQTVRGHVYRSELAIPEQNLAGSSSPWVVQVINPAILEATVGMELFPFELRLEEAHPDALPRHWPVTTMPPERHMGYAVTWFVMAAAIVMAFGFTTVKVFPPKAG